MEPRAFAILLLGSFLLSFLTNRMLLRRLKSFANADRKPTQVRWSSQTKPAIGGISFMVVLAVAMCTGLLMLPAGWGGWQWAGWGLAAAIAFGIGLYDDAFHVRPFRKLLAQLACAIVLVSSGNHIDAFSSDGLNVVISVFWVIGLMNAVNMLDNMDGITAIVSVFIALFVVLGSLISFGTLNAVTWTYGGLVAGIFGFLIYNWHPSRMYMGDGGSQLLGVVLAAGGMEFAWGLPAGSEGVAVWLVPILVFLVPITDTTVVTVNRLTHGVSPATGGRDHTTHNLGYLGMPDNMVAVTFSFLSMIGITLAFLHAYPDGYNDAWVAYFSAAWVLLMVGGMLLITRYNRRRGRYHYKDQ